MPLEFHRTPGGFIHINYNSLTYEDTAANLEIDSGSAYVDTITADYQQWSEGKRCIIENGVQKAPPLAYQALVDSVLADLQNIVDAKTDREALANPEVELALTPTTVVADGVETTTLAIQLVSGVKADLSREDILQADVNISIKVTEPNGIQEFNYVTDSNGQASDTYDAVEPGIYIFESIFQPTVALAQLTAT